MKKTLTVKTLTIGEGIPKICVPIIGRTMQQLREEAKILTTLHADLAEWRVDFFEQAEDVGTVKKALGEIREMIGDLPLIFTFRSSKEGGEKEVSAQDYFNLNKMIAETRLADFIDVELFNNEDDVRELIEFAHFHDVFVIVSNHDFEKTPPKEEIISRLCKAQELGGDIPKIAVMPTCSRDVLTLLDATVTMNEQYADRPIITMSMAGKGVISRLSGEIFGTAVTFGAAEKASAPGQIAAGDLQSILSLLHENL